MLTSSVLGYDFVQRPIYQYRAVLGAAEPNWKHFCEAPAESACELDYPSVGPLRRGSQFAAIGPIGLNPVLYHGSYACRKHIK